MTITIKKKKILVVSSDSRCTERYSNSHAGSGLIIEHARNGQESLVFVRALLPDIVLVGSDVVDITPVDLAHRLRASVPMESVPIVIVGLDQAAIERSIRSNESVPASLRDDQEAVLTKSPPNGHHSDRDQLHSAQNGRETQSNLTCHGVRLDRNKHGVWVQDRPVRLTPTEFKLLWELASRPGYVLSRKELSDRCRRADRAIQTRTVDAHIKSIRRKLDGRAGLIETVHGVGYRFLDIDSASDN